MTPPGTFERVYAAIRQRLREGLYRPGARLEPALLSDELNASVTPVRDALHRLTGERLVDAPRHEGFRVPMMTETLLRHLYAWHLDLLLLALVKQRAVLLTDAIAADGPDADAPPHQRQNGLFHALARSAGNPEHATALDTLIDRLEPVQRLEQMLPRRDRSRDEGYRRGAPSERSQGASQRACPIPSPALAHHPPTDCRPARRLTRPLTAAGRRRPDRRGSLAAGRKLPHADAGDKDEARAHQQSRYMDHICFGPPKPATIHSESWP